MKKSSSNECLLRTYWYHEGVFYILQLIPKHVSGILKYAVCICKINNIKEVSLRLFLNDSIR